jgi:hypothetical protein
VPVPEFLARLLKTEIEDRESGALVFRRRAAADT